MEFLATLLVILLIMCFVAIGLVTGAASVVTAYVALRAAVLWLFAPSTIKFTIKWFVIALVLPTWLRHHAPNFIFGAYMFAVWMYFCYCVCSAIVRTYTSAKARQAKRKWDAMEVQVRQEVLANLKVHRTTKKSRPTGKSVA